MLETIRIVAVADTGLSTGETDSSMHPNFGTNGDKVVGHYSYNVGGDPATADWSCFTSPLEQILTVHTRCRISPGRWRFFSRWKPSKGMAPS